MEKRGVQLCCLLMAMVILVSEIEAQDTSCISQLAPCLNYLNSTRNPASDCCDPLKSVINSNPKCLCNLLSGTTGASGQSGINITQALMLPSRCGLKVNAAACTAASSPNSNTPQPNSASRFSFLNAILVAVLPLIIQISWA